MKNKILATVVLAEILSGGMFAENFIADTPKAEAGIFDKIGEAISGKKTGIDVIDKAKEKVGKQVQDSVKGAVEKALAINVDGMQDHRRDMEEHMRLAALCMATAYQEASLAAGMPADNVSENIKLYTRQLQKKGNFGATYGFTGTPLQDYAGKMGQKFNDMAKNSAVGSGDERIKKLMSSSKNNRTRAMVWSGLALRDAAFVAKESLKGIANFGKVNSLEGAKNFANNLQKDLKTISTVAGDVKKIGDVIGKYNKALNAATKEYDKKFNIKEDKTIKKQIESMKKG